MEVKQELQYKAHLYGINQIKWNSDGNMLASAGNDCSVNIMDINQVELIDNAE
jgi:WD40 repeat protein